MITVHNLTGLFTDESLTEEDILHSIAELGMTTEEEPTLENETVYLYGHKLDLSVNTRRDLIHFIRSQIGAKNNLEAELAKAHRMLAVLAKKNGGRLTFTREEMLFFDDEKTEFLRHIDPMTDSIIFYLHEPA